MDALAGLRVLELGSVVAGPFAAALLADFGAEVIKIERPAHGDGQRVMGPSLDGTSLWFSVLGRNKKAITLDLKHQAGRKVLESLIAVSDVLIENFRPGVLERLGFDWETLQGLNPRLVVLRVSGFGQTGPYSERRGFGKVGEAFSGATNLTGQADSVPTHPSYSLADLSTGVFGAFGVMVALRASQQTQRGQVVDLALYEPLFRMIDWQIPLWKLMGQAVSRTGNEFPFAGAFATDIAIAKDGHYVVVSASSPRVLENLERFVRHKVADLPPTLTTIELVRALRGYIASVDHETVLAELADAGIVAGPVMTPDQLAVDPHIAARGNIVEVADSAGHSIPMPAAVPKLSETPGTIRWAGPALGAHTVEVLRDVLGLSEATIQDLQRDGVI
jgi:crotonobetainyl-CoA:carnitine CoA-transferase CaiB-like acyl-CoA transferase